MKRSELKSSADTTREFIQRGQASSAHSLNSKRRAAVSPASMAQRNHVRGKSCLICGSQYVHPAHIIDRSLCSAGADDARAVVPLCPLHHRLYDNHELSILEYLEPEYREELSFAVFRFGMIGTLQRVTGDRWRVEEAA